MSKEEILKEAFGETGYSLRPKFDIAQMNYALDKYTEQLRTELEAVKKERDELKRQLSDFHLEVKRINQQKPLIP